MKIGRTRFVHLPHRVPVVARAPETDANPQQITVLDAGKTNSPTRHTPARSDAARVLWREIPNWHSVPSDPHSALKTGARAYARATNLHAASASGLIANRVA